MKPVIGRLRSLQSNLRDHKEASSSLANPLPTDYGLQQAHRLGAVLDRGPSNSPLNPSRLFWCSFRTHNDDFLGVVISRGESPGKAASSAIDRLELATSRASIVAIPLDRESEFLSYEDKLIGPEEAEMLLKELDIQIVVR